MTNDAAVLKVIDGLEMTGRLNTSDETILEHVRSSIRRGLPQAKRQHIQAGRVALVGGGPSLAETEDELKELIYEGCTLVTMNGAYNWCLERHFKPGAQIVLDARESNARFLHPAVPRCRYFLASQCHPALFDAVHGRPEVTIFHAVNPENETALADVLNAYYVKFWEGVAGGTTVFTRALALLRMLGYLRFDVFGVDSCWMGDRHHAYDQPENTKDRRLRIDISPVDRPEVTRRFWCAPWHAKQLEDVLQVMRCSGSEFVLNVHGDGLIAHAIREAANISVVQSEEEDGEVGNVGGGLRPDSETIPV